MRIFTQCKYNKFTRLYQFIEGQYFALIFFCLLPRCCTCSTAGACVIHTLLIGECRTKRIIAKRHCIRMAETEPFGRFPVRTWFIMRPALSFHASKSSEYGPATQNREIRKTDFQTIKAKRNERRNQTGRKDNTVK